MDLLAKMRASRLVREAMAAALRAEIAKGTFLSLDLAAMQRALEEMDQEEDPCVPFEPPPKKT
jgi:hypothetical protein